jgi:hypothetical protein
MQKLLVFFLFYGKNVAPCYRKAYLKGSLIRICIRHPVHSTTYCTYDCKTALENTVHQSSTSLENTHKLYVRNMCNKILSSTRSYKERVENVFDYSMAATYFLALRVICTDLFFTRDHQNRHTISEWKNKPLIRRRLRTHRF